MKENRPDSLEPVFVVHAVAGEAYRGATGGTTVQGLVSVWGQVHGITLS